MGFGKDAAGVHVDEYRPTCGLDKSQQVGLGAGGRDIGPDNHHRPFSACEQPTYLLQCGPTG